MLGLSVALGLSLLDSVWNMGLRQFFKVILRIGVAVLVGCVGGVIGGILGQKLVESSTGQPILRLLSSSAAGRSPACSSAPPSAPSSSWPAS